MLLVRVGVGPNKMFGHQSAGKGREGKGKKGRKLARKLEVEFWLQSGQK